MTEEEAKQKMDAAAGVLEREFPDCLFVIVALTDEQTCTRYVSNMFRNDAIELITGVTEEPDFVNPDGHTLN